jgi:hypothetical protein
VCSGKSISSIGSKNCLRVEAIAVEAFGGCVKVINLIKLSPDKTKRWLVVAKY